MLLPITQVGAGHRYGPRIVAGLAVLAASLLTAPFLVGQEPLAARELLNRHVLESLANAVQPSVAAGNPIRDQRRWSRRTIMDALDRQALASAPSNGQPRSAETAHTRIIEGVEPRRSEPAQVLIQPRPLALPVDTRAMASHESERRAQIEPVVVRDLPPLSPLRGAAVPVSAQQSLANMPRALEPAANAPARLTPPPTAEPLRPLDSGRGVAQTSWQRTAELPTQRQASSAQNTNPLRTTSADFRPATDSRSSANPLRR